MIKLLYDIIPFGLNGDFLNIMKNCGRMAAAVCAEKEIILASLNKIISQLTDDSKIGIWIRSDEETILKLHKKIRTACYKEMRSVGFIKFALPEISFVSNKYEVQQLIYNFDQFSSLEIYILSKNISFDFLSYINEHPARMNSEYAFTLLNNSELIINKSGDEDELEVVSKPEKMRSIVNTFLNEKTATGKSK